jgi:alkylation response protein AidB-like acyl-CoA dehydrogenase
VRTRREPNGDGTYALHGSKIYITWGDHDVADNIVHLVLARLPTRRRACAASRSFLAPKILVNPTARWARQQRRPGGIEHKLGIHASPTCTMAVRGRAGRAGGPAAPGAGAHVHDDERARLGVGVEGVGIASAPTSRRWATRWSGRRAVGVVGPAGAPIFDHPTCAACCR